MPNEPDTPSAKPGRLLSLDVMRGLTILAMLLVNNPGDWGSIYAPLRHAEWHGWTPTDLIFPFFLFMVGVAMPYSFAKHATNERRVSPAVWGRIVRRVAVLVLLGLLLNASGRLIGVPLGYQDAWSWGTLRWPGVLQRIGLTYLIASAVVLGLPRFGVRFAVGLTLLGSYAAMLASMPRDTPPAERLSPTGNVTRQVDLAVLGEGHLWSGSPTDPEGLLSTLPATVTVLLGYAIGRFLRTQPIDAVRVARIVGTGVPLVIAGLVWDRLPHPGWGMPINKALWTPSFVWLTAGLAMIALAVCLLLLDVVGKRSTTLRSIATSFQLVGVNAIFAFVASGIVARLLSIVRVGDATLKGWLYQSGIVGPLTSLGCTDPKMHSLVYAIAFVAAWWLILGLMWRRGWAIRV